MVHMVLKYGPDQRVQPGPESPPVRLNHKSRPKMILLNQPSFKMYTNIIKSQECLENQHIHLLEFILIKLTVKTKNFVL